ncbi:conserved hypothetical protein [Cyclobacterium xiamenense]|uniref:DUF4440 domain-containing protein n=1 Tax=Cyclobacterium xiamenense TaxID=1297121 RepID=A0A1H6U1N0_9BACT|nr:SgcJ/EcaC family oxidoreductase [Cyclobacterium xiamenense]SEI86229.1 conserved hypothetical protein [Cyclobacterium xiamenense]
MKFIATFLFSSLVLLLASSCSQNPQPGEAADVAAIKAMSQARADAFNEGDAGSIAAYFTEDAVLMAPNSPKKTGPAAVAAYYQEIFDSYHTELESGYEHVTVDGDLAFGRGFAKVTLFSKSTGDTLYSTSKYLNILERQADGSWKTTHDIWNANE